MRFLAALAFSAVLAQPPAENAWSVHRKGPHGLEGWERTTVEPGLENQGPLPVALLVARNGRVLRSIQGRPFVWSWTFQNDGQDIALEAGPLHFSMECVLENIASGKGLATYDCFHEPLREEAPPWVKLLEKSATEQAR